MKSKENYKVIGVMSGTSMDGMDIAYCRFTLRKKWKFEILAAVTLPYSSGWKDRLASAPLLKAEELFALDAEFGKLIGENCMSFIRSGKLKRIDAIASHGHTIFHQPSRGITVQIGNGNSIHAVTGVRVIYDFRSLDVALGGEGAPLVPVGDQHLFHRYDVCLNLGGIANLSMEKKRQRIAFDICFANMGLNYLAGKNGMLLDRDGIMASHGEIDHGLLADLKQVHDRHRAVRPSLGREGFESDVKHLLDNESMSVANRLRTFCESIAEEVKGSLPVGKIKVLVTGGGAMNPFLMSVIQSRLANAKIVRPTEKIIEFKEALIFGFLGVLRLRDEVNVLKSVTHAKRNSCSGTVIEK